ncbi:MAG: type II toxin-antitoxin system VapC family toxin [Polyangiales bacterium]
MIFVDTNVFMYAVGGEHPLRKPAQQFFDRGLGKTSRARLCTSADVLQELLHVYLPVQRMQTLDAALQLVDGVIDEVWPVEGDDVRLARALADIHSGLGARDLLYIACCKRREVTEIKTYDRALGAVMSAK